MNNTDLREMLELAALAAGHRHEVTDAGFQLQDADGFWRYWNPHADDGDSRRLQVALGIDLRISAPFPNDPMRSCVVLAERAMEDGWIGHRDVTTDPCAAARLAILQVAAEIGRRIKAERERAK